MIGDRRDTISPLLKTKTRLKNQQELIPKWNITNKRVCHDKSNNFRFCLKKQQQLHIGLTLK